jgi:hypothetical protein
VASHGDLCIKGFSDCLVVKKFTSNF